MSCFVKVSAAYLRKALGPTVSLRSLSAIREALEAKSAACTWR